MFQSIQGKDNGQVGASTTNAGAAVDDDGTFDLRGSRAGTIEVHDAHQISDWICGFGYAKVWPILEVQLYNVSVVISSF